MEVTATEAKNRLGQAFYRENKAWVDEQNELIKQYGIPGEEHRVW